MYYAYRKWELQLWNTLIRLISLKRAIDSCFALTYDYEEDVEGKEDNGGEWQKP